MLQRAASNAYSWWMASHIRTKQSKWLEQNLQDMEEKVQYVLRLITEDGDSFAKKAEMYYKKRPELIQSVEESFRAYRSLAERYDHLSTELQNANNTIASVFPEQVQFAMDDDDDAPTPKPKKPLNMSKNVPEVPKAPVKDLKSLLSRAAVGEKKFQLQKPGKKSSTVKKVRKSGLSKSEGLKEIDKIQKKILALQTEKEFVKSSYENGLAKYWEIENNIKGLQEEVSVLQDEFDEGLFIEDNEARSLMAAAAVKTCQDTLAELEKKHESSVEEARVESLRVKDALKLFESLTHKVPNDQATNAKDRIKKFKESNQEAKSATQAKEEVETLREKLKEQYDAKSNESLTVSTMAEKIDEVVSKVINLETAISSQTALVDRLRSENNEISEQIQILESEKATLTDGKNGLRKQLEELEEALQRAQELNTDVETQCNNLQIHFTEAHYSLDHISHKLENVKADEELSAADSSKTNKGSRSEAKLAVYHANVLKRSDKDQKKPTVLAHKNEASSVKITPSVLHEERPNTVDASIEAVNTPSEAKSTVGPEDGFKKSDKGHIRTILAHKDEETSTKVTPSTTPEETPNPDNGSVKPQDTPSEAKPAVDPANDLLTSEKGQKPRVLEHKDEESSAEVTSTPHEEIPNPDDGFSVKAVDTPSSSNADKGNDSFQSPKTKHRKKKQNASDGSVKSKEVVASPSVGSQAGDIDSPRQTIGSFLDMEVSEDDDDLKRTREYRPDWQKLFTTGMADKEKILLKEYTATLRNYKDLKQKYSVTENDLFDTSVQMKQLKSSNAQKDNEIKALHKKLDLLIQSLDGNQEALKALEKEAPIAKEKNDITKELLNDDGPTTSVIEEKFRGSLDELLEENLVFWMKFSTTIQETQKFETGIQDLKLDISKLEDRRRKDGSSHARSSVKSDARPLYKHLMEIQTELNVWMEKSSLLKDELQCRFASLCDIQEEITKALKTSAEDGDFDFTSYQAAKFKGEILNMKQENNKVGDELQAGLDHVTSLQLEVEKAMAKLNEEYKFSASIRQQQQAQGKLTHAESRSRIPLRSFIFGVAPKKQKKSFFAVVAPAMHRKYQGKSKSNSNQQ